MIKHILVSIILCACLFRHGNGKGDSCVILFQVTIEVTITSELPGTLYVHCASKNDDLGNHNLTSNGIGFQFQFCVIPWTTLFYCDFRWNAKKAHINVYNAKWRHNYCGVKVTASG